MLKLGEIYTTFEPCSNLSDIFFDRVNQRICTVRGNGEMGVTAKGFEKENIVSFRVQDKGKIIVVCFSTDLKIACICRNVHSMPPSQLLICSNGIDGAMLNPFLIQNGVIHRLCKFEVDFGCSNNRPMLYERDITIASLYEKLYVIVITSSSNGSTIDQLNLYELTNDTSQPAKLAHNFFLHLDGLVATHVIDNLVIVHHKLTANSYIFDLAVDKTTNPLTITAIEISEKLFESYSTNTAQYFPGWYIFSPNLVVDPRFGIFSKLDLIVNTAQRYIIDKFKLLNFLMHRTRSEEILIEILKRYLEVSRSHEHKILKINHVGKIFQQILNFDNCGTVVTNHQEFSKYSLVPTPFIPIKINQEIIINNIFMPLRENSLVDKKYLSDVVLEFLLVVKQNNTTVHHYLPEFIIEILLFTEQYVRLKQLLQYRVIEDSRHVALTLLQKGEAHPPLLQLAIDILARKGEYEIIIQFLLDKGRVIEAMRRITNQNIDKSSALKFLEVAWATNNRQIKYTVFTFLLEKFPKIFEHLTTLFEQYTKEFKTLFDNEEIEEAEHRFRLAKIATSPIPIAQVMQQSESIDISINSLINNEPVGSLPKNFRIGS